MKLSALALLLLTSCSVSAAPPGDPKVRYTAGFAAGSTEADLQKVVEVYKQRLGKMAGDASIRADAKKGAIGVELPVGVAFQQTKPERVLERALNAGESKSTLAIDPVSPHGELAQAGDEWLRVVDASCERGLFGSTVAVHEAGTKVLVYEDQKVRALLASTGEFEMLEEAQDDYLAAKQTTRQAERDRFDAWRKEHATARLRAFDSLARERGGPIPDTLWRRLRSTGGYALLVRSADPRFRFGNRDIQEVGYSQDSMGYPAVSFELKKERQKDFGEWTESILGRNLAIVLDDEILTLATVRSRLPGSGIIEGGSSGFSKEEVKALVESLRPSGLPPLPLPLLTFEVEFGR